MNRADTSGGALAYHDEGDGPAVLLLHGFPLTSYLWRGLIPALASRHPDAKIICGHTGGTWELGIRTVRSLKHVSADLAGSDPTADGATRANPYFHEPSLRDSADVVAPSG